MQLVKSPLEGVPRTGVTSVGEVSITNLVPVPVCEAMLVAFPTEVITPVRLAFVVAVTEMPLPSAVASKHRWHQSSSKCDRLRPLK